MYYGKNIINKTKEQAVGKTYRLRDIVYAFLFSKKYMLLVQIIYTI